MTPDQLRQPAVRTPVRKPHLKLPSRSTPTLPQPQTPASLPKSPSSSRQLAIRDDDLNYQSAPSSLKGSQLDRQLVEAPGSSASSRPTLHERTVPQAPPLTPVPEVIDLENMPPPTLEQTVGHSVPTTPPELRLTPAKRPASPATTPPPSRRQSASALVTSHGRDDLHGGHQFSDGRIRYPDLQLDAGDLFHDVPDDNDREDHNSRQCRTTEPQFSQQFLPGHNGFMLQDDGIQFRPEFFDGTAAYNAYKPNHVCFQRYQKSPDYAGDGRSDDSDSDRDSQDEQKPLTGEKKLSRLEQKALDKEIPWQRIMDGPQHILDAFIKAAQSEEASWMSWQSVGALTEKEADIILQDGKKRRRVLRSRAAFREKAKGLPPIKPKCRIVALGHMDPDLFSLCRESAMSTRGVHTVGNLHFWTKWDASLWKFHLDLMVR